MKKTRVGERNTIKHIRREVNVHVHDSITRIFEYHKPSES